MSFADFSQANLSPGFSARQHIQFHTRHGHRSWDQNSLPEPQRLQARMVNPTELSSGDPKQIQLSPVQCRRAGPNWAPFVRAKPNGPPAEPNPLKLRLVQSIGTRPSRHYPRPDQPSDSSKAQSRWTHPRRAQPISSYFISRRLISRKNVVLFSRVNIYKSEFKYVVK